MSEENIQPGVVPNKLPSMTREEVIARAQRILDERGKPPYTPKTFGSEFQEWYPDGFLSEDECAILSEFVYFWLPYLVEKEKK